MTGASTVTPAELKSLRESLGFTGESLASYLGLSGGRTVRHWESGKYPIADGAAEEIRALEALTDSYVQETAAALRGQTNPTLTVYRDDAEYHHAHPDMARFPAAWHRAVAARVARLIPELRIEFPE
ncbi:helix-turn-helix domain-containing protein [Nocardiopsis terrae]|uniref:helix-turn-helix domain-containing protein n=1 Tax=Streptomyces sp. NPDC057554 TaxID=3350538 RepID=UPI0036A8A809